MIKLTRKLVNKDPCSNKRIFAGNTFFYEYDSIESFLEDYPYYFEKFKIVYKDDIFCCVINDSDEDIITYNIIELMELITKKEKNKCAKGV